jgi:hypothetical protein
MGSKPVGHGLDEEFLRVFEGADSIASGWDRPVKSERL